MRERVCGRGTDGRIVCNFMRDCQGEPSKGFIQYSHHSQSSADYQTHR